MNTELMILNKPIRQIDGLYCLNDLHKASGGENRHRPTEWLRLQQTNEMIAELQNEKADVGIPTSQNKVISTVRGFGKQQGTYACRELVLAYATWISPRFFLLVLRTFDSVACGGALPAGKIQPLADYPPPVPWQPEPVLPRPPRNLAEARALFAQIDHAEMQIQQQFSAIVAQRSQLHSIQRMTQSWRDYWLTVENDQ